MAAGGQWAPLVPAFHAAFFSAPSEERVILNIGGIANITCLPNGNREAVSGFATGPGNTLLDGWAGKWLGKPFDESGVWAAGGQVKQDLLAQMLKDPYFRRSPPKSTGPEYFNLEWLQQQLKGSSLDPQDIQATLTEFTALSISLGIKKQAAACQRVIACGGGVFNKHLMRRLQDSLQPVPVETIQSLWA